jgi:DASH complex subunit DAD3
MDQPPPPSTPGAGLLAPPPPELSPIEQDVLDEYERLAGNMKKVPPYAIPTPKPLRRLTCSDRRQLATILDHLASQPTSEILDGLRELERKTSLVFTLLKASVYSIVLQQEIGWGDGGGGEEQEGEQ